MPTTGTRTQRPPRTPMRKNRLGENGDDSQSCSSGMLRRAFGVRLSKSLRATLQVFGLIEGSNDKDGEQQAKCHRDGFTDNLEAGELDFLGVVQKLEATQPIDDEAHHENRERDRVLLPCSLDLLQYRFEQCHKV